MRIGEQKQYDGEQSLFEWTAQSGFGIVGLVGRESLPVKLVEYCMSAFPFFGLSNHRTLEEIARIGAFATYYHIDVQNPYSLMMGVSDVDFTNDWCEYTFDIIDKQRGRTIEADPEKLETFRWIPGQAEHVYQAMLKRGGDWFTEHKGNVRMASILDTLPNGAGSEIQWLMDGELHDEAAYDQIHDHVVEEVFNEITKGDRGLQMFYFEVAAWAAYLWFAGPEGRAWRNCHHDIFMACAADGMAFMYDGGMIEKEYVLAQERPPQSCAVCGLDSYCVELAHINGTTRFICEKHLNDEPVFEEATCGTKVCKYVQCPHHPYHGQDHGLMNQLRRTGQLTAKANQKDLLSAPEMFFLQNK